VIKFKENLKNIKITLIAPIFNEIQHLDACLENISNQFIKYELDIEFIIIDDCSTDGTYEKLKSLESDIIRIFRTSKNSGGAGEPRNIGLQNACGQYVVFYDFGDVIDFSRLTEICSLMEHNNSNIAVANHVDIHPDQEIIKNPLNIYKDSPYLTSLKETPQLIHNPFSWGKVYNLKMVA
jgi:glycosyltransferase involved in cell wall biosynthesis